MMTRLELYMSVFMLASIASLFCAMGLLWNGLKLMSYLVLGAGIASMLCADYILYKDWERIEKRA